MLFLLFFYKAYGLWRPERQLGRPFFELFLSEAGSEKAFRTQRVRRMILFLVGASGVHIHCCLNRVEVRFLLFGFGALIVLLPK